MRLCPTQSTITSQTNPIKLRKRPCAKIQNRFRIPANSNTIWVNKFSHRYLILKLLNTVLSRRTTPYLRTSQFSIFSIINAFLQWSRIESTCISVTVVRFSESQSHRKNLNSRKKWNLAWDKCFLQSVFPWKIKFTQ